MYLFAGEVFDVDLDLGLATADGPADVTVHFREPAIASRPAFDIRAIDARQEGRPVALGTVDGRWVAWIPPVLQATIDADEIEVQPFPDVPVELVADFLGALVLPFRLVTQSRWVFHGSAVRRPDGPAIVVFGGSGMGKSTTAAALSADGWQLVSDDAITGRVDGAQVVLTATGSQLHLRGHAQCLADLIAPGPHATDPDGRVVVTATCTVDPTPVDRLLFLTPGLTGAPRQLSAPRVMQGLLDNSRFRAWHDVAFRTHEFEAAADIADRVPGFEIGTPHDCRTPDEFRDYVHAFTGG